MFWYTQSAGKIGVNSLGNQKSPPTYVFGDYDIYPHKLYIAGQVIECTLTICMLKVDYVIEARPSGKKLNHAIKGTA